MDNTSDPTKKDPPPQPGQTPGINDATLLTPPSQNPQTPNTPRTIASSGGSPASLTYTSASQLSIPVQDLSGDALLTSAPKALFDNRSVPTLGGIPLLAKLGQGGMGAVYYGVKVMLRREVAVKVLPLHLAQQQPQLIERFLREAQIAAKIESPHLVHVSDVNEHGGLFYLVMEYVSGASAGSLLKKIAQSGQRGFDEATALEICIAATTGLVAAHTQGVIHRDIKPDNILVPQEKQAGTPQFAAAKIADLGLARGEDMAGASLTGAQSAMGTPGYMAPEQALNAKKAGKPADVFSMGAALYALLAGQAPFKGETVTEAVIATLQKAHEPIATHRADISPATAALIDRCLNKEPSARYVDASALLEALRVCRSALGQSGASQDAAMKTLIQLQHTHEVGETLRPSSASGRPISGVPANPGTPMPTPAPLSTSAPPAVPSAVPAAGSKKVVAAVAVLLLLVGGFFVFQNLQKSGTESEQRFTTAIIEGETASDNGKWDVAIAAFQRALQEKPNDSGALKGLINAKEHLANGAATPVPAAAVEIGIACGHEKEEWMQWAVDQFATSPTGKGVRVNLLFMGPQESQKAVILGNKKINVYAPASGIYKDAFIQEWAVNHPGENPIAREDSLALTPLAFMMFEDHYQAFIKKYKSLNFATLNQALSAKGGWGEIADKPEWGRLTFAMSNPTEFNNGMTALVLMAYDFNHKDRELVLRDVTDNAFLSWSKVFSAAFAHRGPPAALIKEMVLKGPSAYDGVFTYESAVIVNLKNAEGRWGGVRVVYPEANIWNDNPYYILNVPWSTAEQRKVAGDFLTFLLSEPIQKQLLVYGFRPGNPKVGILGPDSPFERYKSLGLKVEIPITVEIPKKDVIESLFDNAAKWLGE
jgi:serine/threonine protein kinase